MFNIQFWEVINVLSGFTDRCTFNNNNNNEDIVYSCFKICLNIIESFPKCIYVIKHDANLHLGKCFQNPIFFVMCVLGNSIELRERNVVRHVNKRGRHDVHFRALQGLYFSSKCCLWYLFACLSVLFMLFTSKIRTWFDMKWVIFEMRLNFFTFDQN